MEILTPSHLTAYLQALALQHPEVNHVITGEEGRAEASTLNLAEYPQVRIETPAVTIPIAESQKILSSRIYVLAHAPAGRDPDNDLGTDTAYRIAEDLVAAITSHAYNSDIGLSLRGDGIEIEPVISRGSDQTRGWMFDIAFEVNKALCKDNGFDPDEFSMPQFRWSNNPVNTFSLDNISIMPAGAVLTWYWQEAYEQATAVAFDPDDGITLSPVVENPTYRIIHVWLRLVHGSITQWSYAAIDTRIASGVSLPFIPTHPI